MAIDYKINTPITTEDFIDLLKRTTLADRRPVNDYDCMDNMVKHSNLMITAWDKEKLIGVARSITDFSYACYLSDLAVDPQCHNLGIGKKLQKLTQEQLGPQCKIILVAAPATTTYYEHIGFTRNNRCWILERDQQLSG